LAVNRDGHRLRQQIDGKHPGEQREAAQNTDNLGYGGGDDGGVHSRQHHGGHQPGEDPAPAAIIHCLFAHRAKYKDKAGRCGFGFFTYLGTSLRVSMASIAVSAAKRSNHDAKSPPTGASSPRRGVIAANVSVLVLPSSASAISSNRR